MRTWSLGGPRRKPSSYARLNGMQLTGRDRGHLVALESPRCTLHAAAVRAVPCAARGGSARRFRPRARLLVPRLRPPARDLERQVPGRAARARPQRAGRSTWRPSTTAARVETILLWSALPGASRHHWGSDIDVADGHVMARGYQPQLVVGEYRARRPVRGALRLARRQPAALRLLPPLHAPRPRRAAGALAHLLRAGRQARARAHERAAARGGRSRGAGVEGEAAILARLPSIRERYLLDVDAPPRMRSRWARLRSR